MTSDALKTLFHPFEAGTLDVPVTGTRALFLGAEPALRLPSGWDAELRAVQGFRPDYLALKHTGIKVSPRAEGDSYDMALVLAGRHRGQNELRMAEAVERVKTGGLILGAGRNEDGIASARKRLDKKNSAYTIAQSTTPLVVVEKAGWTDVAARDGSYHPPTPPVPLIGHVSKYHGMAFWLERTPQADAFAGAIKKWYGSWPLIDGRFHTAPGMFSFDRIDPGSRLLAENLPGDLKGAVADFCAGWGYLSAETIARNPGIGSLDLYEADYESLEAARKNVVADIPVDFFWHDLLAEPVARRYDAILMNPPFHTGRAAEPAIGQGMIRAAAAALKPGGRLFLVANRQLPYERILAALFASAQEIASNRTFKVFAAKR